MAKRQALVHVHTFLGIVFINNVAAIAQAEVAGSVGQVVAPVLAASAGSFDLVLASSDLVAAFLV